MSKLIHSCAVVSMMAMTIVSSVGEPFDYHQIRGRKSVVKVVGLHEGEALAMRGTSREQTMGSYADTWSSGAHLLWHGKVGESLETSVHVSPAGRYRVTVQLTAAPDYGQSALLWNGNVLKDEIELYAPTVRLAELLDLGEITLDEGDHSFALRLTGGHPKANTFRKTHYWLGLDFIEFEALDLPVVEEVPVTPEPSVRVPVATFDDMRPVMAEACFRCHGGEKTEGKIDLKALTSKQDVIKDIELARKVVEALRFNEMPPEDETPLSAADHARLLGMFQSYVDEYLQEQSVLPPIVMRRMNRYEYNNAVRDLLALKGDIFALPEKPIRAMRPYFDPASGHFPDTVRVSNRALGKNQIEQHLLTGVTPFAIDLQAEHGFNNRGDQLSVSPILLESFLGLGQSIVNSPEFDGYTDKLDSLFQCQEGLAVEAQRSLAEERLRPLLEMAFRGLIDDTVFARYANHFHRELERRQSFSQSMKSVVAAVLASPRFIYITERKHDVAAAERLTGYELATRLAFFLWSSIPDEELLAVARSEQLLQQDVLETQVRRLLEDPRSQALSQSFARQWLRLDQLITAVPDFERFEVYYARIGCEQWKFGLQTMLEPLLLFESILVEDRSIMLLVDSNYTYRSDEMESWYKHDQPFGNKPNRNRFDTNIQNFSRRMLDTRREGGVITSAATLTMTSAPLRTNPINRGAWMATVILNRPPPPPPDIVPEIEADDAAIEAQGLTLRQRLVQHQVNPSCVSCHQRIDPLGFALENFDAVGRWRDAYTSGLPIDATGKLFGEAEFTDVVGLKDTFLKNPEWFMRAFSEHLLSYALGRELKIEDTPTVDRIVRETMADHGQFSTVVIQVATSYPFLHKTNQTAALSR